MTDGYDNLNKLKTLGFLNNESEEIFSVNDVDHLRVLSNQLLTKFELKTHEAENQIKFKRTGVGEGAFALTRFSQHGHSILVGIFGSMLNVKAIAINLY